MEFERILETFCVFGAVMWGMAGMVWLAEKYGWWKWLYRDKNNVKGKR